MVGSVREHDRLLQWMRSHAEGGKTSVDGVTVEYGNVTALLSFVTGDSAFWPFDFRASYVGHLDHIPIDRKRALERLHGLNKGELTSPTSKADLFIVTETGQPVFLSVKDSTTTAKLGQVSRAASYGRASLQGGLYDCSTLLERAPRILTHADTHLSASRFNKLNNRDRSFAYVKRHFRRDWETFVAKSLESAVAQVSELVNVLQADRDSLVEFVAEVLAGSLRGSSNYFLLIGQRLVEFQKLLSRLKSTTFNVVSERYETAHKVSYVVWVEIKSARYCLTKIEPAFDGASDRSEQTKGIIFYFQQHLSEGNHYKKLFTDLVA